ncbi:hypothetical protein BVG96_01200 [Serratia marcescens]|nr:hypothetical protein BVG96_01200 [Serratia marcescens]
MSCAQYFPRLACALHVSLFMQLHERPQAAPVLVRQGMKSAFSCMQNHAPYACTRNLRLASQEKGCFGRGEKGMPRDAVESCGAECD